MESNDVTIVRRSVFAKKEAFFCQQEHRKNYISKAIMCIKINE